MLRKELFVISLGILVIVTRSEDGVGRSLRFPAAAPNKVVDVSTSCNSTWMEVSVVMDRPYKGMISAKDFSHECGMTGECSGSSSFLFPISAFQIIVLFLLSQTLASFTSTAINVVAQHRFMFQVRCTTSSVYRFRRRDAASDSPPTRATIDSITPLVSSLNRTSSFASSPIRRSSSGAGCRITP